MTDEGFLRRWARRKTEARSGIEPLAESHMPVADMPVADMPVADAPMAELPVPVAEAPAPAPADVPLPTMDDVARLTADSDFSAFVARGVDAAVRRTALKKLFADPHFNAMDGLDVYIDDYTKPSPVSEAMLASLEHAKNALQRVVEAVEEPPADEDAPDDTNKTT
ncbi:DUF3306 domain-containing protein [Telluria mixta]|uniref:DUF3306 domain-containing protein n=1 Tax=Telluria mixta TaxID=34071 RepID=A0ABT2BSE0_9BURK|nr:DUF3306 domain-containing protein [Telluria mixta]MCS0628033.1 DUF3306 domain-containing protein [Telluria mixta]WEM93850.1 DUF3306 domain-containing protein [Telluria mixta]